MNFSLNFWCILQVVKESVDFPLDEFLWARFQLEDWLVNKLSY